MQTAPLWRRLAAMIYDSVVLAAIWMVVGFLVVMAFNLAGYGHPGERIETPTPLQDRVMLAAMLLSAYLFFAWFWTHSGQTIGMMAWKIKVQNADGNPIGYRQSLFRFLLAPLSLALAGAGYWWMLFDPRKETLHDKASASVVVKVPKVGV